MTLVFRLSSLISRAFIIELNYSQEILYFLDLSQYSLLSILKMCKMKYLFQYTYPFLSADTMFQMDDLNSRVFYLQHK